MAELTAALKAAETAYAREIESLDGEPVLTALVAMNRSAKATVEWAAATARGES